jgi:hypothetical protein
VEEDALRDLRAHLQRDQERAARVPRVPERDALETGPASPEGEHMRVMLPGSIGVPYFVAKTRS